jgi:hypothetical protein
MGKLGKKDFFDRFSGLARECLNWNCFLNKTENDFLKIFMSFPKKDVFSMRDTGSKI